MSLQKQVSLHGRRAFVTSDDILCGQGGLAAGGAGKPTIVFPGPDIVAVFDDFLGDKGGLGVVDTGKVVPSSTVTTGQIYDTGTAGHFFITRKGDSGLTGTLVAGTNGVFRLTSSETITTATVAGSSAGIVGPQLAWKANQGPGGTTGRLRMGARIKQDLYVTATGKQGLFLGFTDSTAAEVPMHDTGGTADMATATDAVGFMWSTDGDTGWRGMAVNGNTVQEITGGLTTTTPTDNKWTTLEVEIHRGISDTGGTATFYIDGVVKGAITSPLATSVALTPAIYITDTGGVGKLDIDWVNVSAPRDTGL